MLRMLFFFLQTDDHETFLSTVVQSAEEDKNSNSSPCNTVKHNDDESSKLTDGDVNETNSPQRYFADVSLSQVDTFSPEEPVSLYYALFPTEKANGNNNEEVFTEISMLKETEPTGNREVFSLIIPYVKQPIISQLQHSDNGPDGSSEFMSAYTKITEGKKGAEKAGEDQGLDSKSTVYGKGCASKMYPSGHNEHVEERGTGKAREGKNFVMSGTYRHKPPQKLSIPDAFQN